MSEILTINTEQGIIKEENIEPLPLYNEHHPMLRQAVPEYDVTRLPNHVMSNMVKRLKLKLPSMQKKSKNTKNKITKSKTSLAKYT